MTRLEGGKMIPEDRIRRMVTRPMKSFSAKPGFIDPEMKLKKVTAALLIRFKAKEYMGHDFILGGPKPISG